MKKMDKESDSACRDACSSHSSPGELFSPANKSTVFISGQQSPSENSFLHGRTDKTLKESRHNSSRMSGNGTTESSKSSIVTTVSSPSSSESNRNYDVVMGTIKYIDKWGGLDPHRPQSHLSSDVSSESETTRVNLTGSGSNGVRKVRQKEPTADYSHFLSVTNEISSFPSSSPGDTGSATSQLRVSSSESVVLKAAADCLHAQDFPQMIQVLTSAKQDSVVVLFGIGLAYYKLRKYLEAETYFDKMVEATTLSLSFHSSRYLAEYYLGEIALSRRKYNNAADLYDKAAKSYGTETVAKFYRMLQPSLSSVFSKQGSALRQGQRILEAVQAYKSALHHISTKKDELAVHTSLGNLYQSLGENKSALEQYKSSIELAEDLRDYVSLGWAYGNMGNAYLGLFDKDKAISSLEKSLELALGHEPTPQAIGRAYNNLGTAHQSSGSLDKAEEYYDLALNQAIYGIDTAGEARVRGNYGNLLMLKKNYCGSISHYTETLALTSDRSTRSTALHNRGCAYYEKGEFEKKEMLGLKKSDPDTFYITFTGPMAKSEEKDLVSTRSMQEDYIQGAADLRQVVEYHEETFQTMRGSQRGLNLSVSLFETNSRTFHRLQDCHYSQQNWDTALECAEQSRARSLGELLLDRKFGQLGLSLVSPLKMSQIREIVKLPGKTIMYVSYTGARLLAWVFVPRDNGEVITNMYQVALEDDQFDGHSLDYFLRYTLSEALNEKDVDMYAHCNYQKSPLSKLFKIFAAPLLTILERVGCDVSSSSTDVVIIPDSYTSLVPMFALFSSEGKFLGDSFNLRIMPSLLTLGILSQQPPVVVSVPKDSDTFCVVGNPTIPPFKYEGTSWNLGKLPFATQEAESVAHILDCRSTLHEQATKNVVVSMLRNAKVVHLATHGSAVAGFLAFAGIGSSLGGTVNDAKMVLLYPEEVEKMTISPALVVLSSCDSGRGAVKADGIQGMARAFILAGAQAVLTTLWRVPDESAAVFMKFFYQYLMEGLKASSALRKAMLSIRSFLRYSNYIHWSGYQLTGRELKFDVDKQEKKLGPCPVFPRLDVVNKLTKALVKDRFMPTDVQVIHGPPGLRPLEPVLQFVQRNHTHFPGGVYFVSAHNEHFCTAAVDLISQELSSRPPMEQDSQVLLIIDGLHKLPEEQASFLHQLMAKTTCHVILTMESRLFDKEVLKKQIDRQLLRGTADIALEPLSVLQVTERLVHGIITKCNEFTPYNREQEIISAVAQKSLGSPDLVDIISALLGKFISKVEEEESSGCTSFLELFDSRFCSAVYSRSCSISYSTCSSVDEEVSTETEDIKSRDTGVGTSMEELKERLKQLDHDQSHLFDGDFISHLIDGFHFSKSEFLMLATLSLFNGAPLPFVLVQQVQSLIQEALPDESHSPIQSLLSASLLHHHPSPVIAPPTLPPSSSTQLIESFNYHIPLIISQTVCENLSKPDLVFSLTLAYTSLQKLIASPLSSDSTLRTSLSGLLQSILIEAEKQEDIYKTIYRLYLTFNN